MPALTGPALVIAALLAVAGAQKVLDPTMTVGALRALRLPSAPVLVRVGAAAELALGVLAIGVGGAVVWSLVAASYVAFAIFVVAALRHGTMLGSCGCFGRDDTPPHWSHVGLNLVLAGVAVALAAQSDGAPLDAVADDPGVGVAVSVLAGLALYLLYALYVELPRTLAAARSARSATR
ncbi:MAG: MauE/DoxX family redox-associated membrane protein [Acidimicrobiales bacterium]